MSKIEIKNYPDIKKGLLRNENAKIEHVEIAPNYFLLSHLEGKKYFFKTYGCQANVRDKETMAGMLDTCKMSETFDVNDADLIIIVTCAVRENAEDKVFGEIGSLKKLKEQNKDLLIAICGCMVEQPHIVDRILSVYRQVDLIFGTHNISSLLDLIENVIRNNRRVVDVPSKCGDVFELSCSSKRIDKHKAFVNIIYGCDKFCTYCIVPYVRGKERSRRHEDIINEIIELRDLGYQEVTLLGQNVNSYGKDLYGKEYTFKDLLEDAAKTNIPRIRFMTSHPFDFNDDVIDVIAKYDNIMKFIHLPVQSGNDEMLKKMNRHYDMKKYMHLIDTMKEKMENVSFSTDIIVGFPNETEEQFLDTMKLCETVGFDNVYTFIYSKRKGTPAANMIDNISDEEKSDRFNRLKELIDGIIEKRANEMVGKEYLVLVDGVSKKNENILSGYTETNKIINFEGSKDLIGHIVKVKVLESHVFSLNGELVNER